MLSNELDVDCEMWPSIQTDCLSIPFQTQPQFHQPDPGYLYPACSTVSPTAGYYPGIVPPNLPNLSESCALAGGIHHHPPQLLRSCREEERASVGVGGFYANNNNLVRYYGLKRCSADIRREKSRGAAKTRRQNENDQFVELASLLPLEPSITCQLDKASVVRLALSTLSLRVISCRGLPVWSYPSGENFILGPPISLTPVCAEAVHNRDIMFRHNGPLRKLAEHMEYGMPKNIEQNLDGFFIIISSTGKLDYVSQTVANFTGLALVDIIGMNATDFIHPEDWCHFAYFIGLSDDENSSNRRRKKARKHETSGERNTRKHHRVSDRKSNAHVSRSFTAYFGGKEQSESSSGSYEDSARMCDNISLEDASADHILPRLSSITLRFRCASQKRANAGSRTPGFKVFRLIGRRRPRLAHTLPAKTDKDDENVEAAWWWVGVCQALPFSTTVGNVGNCPSFNGTGAMSSSFSSTGGGYAQEFLLSDRYHAVATLNQDFTIHNADSIFEKYFLSDEGYQGITTHTLFSLCHPQDVPKLMRCFRQVRKITQTVEFVRFVRAPGKENDDDDSYNGSTVLTEMMITHAYISKHSMPTDVLTETTRFSPMANKLIAILSLISL